MSRASINYREIAVYLAPTFALTWIAESVLIYKGFRYDGVIESTAMLALVAIMWIPGLCGLCAQKLLGRPLRELGLRFGSLRAYLAWLAIIPAIFAGAYLLPWFFGFATPDWSLKELLALETNAPAPDLPSQYIFWYLLATTTIFGTCINFFGALGEELGWRGYLLPRLAPLGKLRCDLVLGIIWGLWHLPLLLVGFNYAGHPLAGIVMMCAYTTLLGSVENTLATRYGSVFIAAWIHSANNAQSYGVWKYAFPGIDSLWSGGTGMTGLICWGTAALLAWRWHSKNATR